MPNRIVHWTTPTTLAAYLEHDGGINDDGDGSYLIQMAEDGIHATADNPIILGVCDGTASIYDGNHRLILALQQELELVPYVIQSVESSFPGVTYDGSLGWPE